MIVANAGLWPPPTPEELRRQGSLSAEQAEQLASRVVGHPGRTVTDPAVLPRPLSSLKSAFIAGPAWLTGFREAALLESLRGAPERTFVTLEGGHWRMLTAPEELATRLHDVSLDGGGGAVPPR